MNQQRQPVQAAQTPPEQSAPQPAAGESNAQAQEQMGDAGAGSDTPTLDAAQRTWYIDLSGIPFPPGSDPPNTLAWDVSTWAQLSDVAYTLATFLVSNNAHPKPGAIVYEMDRPLNDEWMALQHELFDMAADYGRREESDPQYAELDLGTIDFEDCGQIPLADLMRRVGEVTSNFYVICDRGSQYRYLTEEEYRQEYAEALQTLRDEVMPELEQRLEGARQLLLEQERVNQDAGVVAWVSSWFNPMDAPSDNQWDNASVVLAETRRALEGNDLAVAVEAARHAQVTFNTMATAVNRYIEGQQAGAAGAIILLQITSTAAFSVASGLAGASFLANAGMMANMSFNVGSAVVQNVASQSGNMIFLDEDFDWGSLAADASLAAGGTVISDVVAPRLMGDLPGALASRFPEHSRGLIEQVVRNTGQNVISGLATDAIQLAGGEISYEDLLMNVTINVGGTFIGEGAAPLLD